MVRELEKLNPTAPVSVDKVADPSLIGSMLRPDAIQVGLKGRVQSAILDVKCPFPTLYAEQADSFTERSDERNLL